MLIPCCLSVDTLILVLLEIRFFQGSLLLIPLLLLPSPMYYYFLCLVLPETFLPLCLISRLPLPHSQLRLSPLS